LYTEKLLFPPSLHLTMFKFRWAGECDNLTRRVSKSGTRRELTFCASYENYFLNSYVGPNLVFLTKTRVRVEETWLTSLGIAFLAEIKEVEKAIGTIIVK
jgi:hypothetical protein